MTGGSFTCGGMMGFMWVFGLLVLALLILLIASLIKYLFKR